MAGLFALHEAARLGSWPDRPRHRQRIPKDIPIPIPRSRSFPREPWFVPPRRDAACLRHPRDAHGKVAGVARISAATRIFWILRISFRTLIWRGCAATASIYIFFPANGSGSGRSALYLPDRELWDRALAARAAANRTARSSSAGRYRRVRPPLGLPGGRRPRGVALPPRFPARHEERTPRAPLVRCWEAVECSEGGALAALSSAERLTAEGPPRRRTLLFVAANSRPRRTIDTSRGGPSTVKPLADDPSGAGTQPQWLFDFHLRLGQRGTANECSEPGGVAPVGDRRKSRQCDASGMTIPGSFVDSRHFVTEFLGGGNRFPGGGFTTQGPALAPMSSVSR